MLVNFNEYSFEKALLERLNATLSQQIDNQKEVLDLLIKLLMSTKGTVQLSGCQCFVDILAKIRFNIESSIKLSNELFEDFRFKASVNLLYRSIVDDVINGYYLLGTVALSDHEQRALNNELDIFHKEFLLSSLKAIDAEAEFTNYVNELCEKEPIEKIDISDDIKKDNPQLFNINGKWKTNSEIRSTTPTFLVQLMNQPEKGFWGFISESKKIEFIKARGLGAPDNLTVLFKYLSQFQHYSPKTHQLINSDIDYDLTVYEKCIDEVLLFLHQIIDVLQLKAKDELKGELISLLNRIFDVQSEN